MHREIGPLIHFFEIFLWKNIALDDVTTTSRRNGWEIVHTPPRSDKLQYLSYNLVPFLTHLTDLHHMSFSRWKIMFGISLNLGSRDFEVKGQSEVNKNCTNRKLTFGFLSTHNTLCMSKMNIFMSFTRSKFWKIDFSSKSNNEGYLKRWKKLSDPRNKKKLKIKFYNNMKPIRRHKK